MIRKKSKLAILIHEYSVFIFDLSARPQFAPNFRCKKRGAPARVGQYITEPIQGHGRGPSRGVSVGGAAARRPAARPRACAGAPGGGSSSRCVCWL